MANLLSNLLLVLYCVAASIICVQTTTLYRDFTVINNCQETIRLGRTGGQCLQSDTERYPGTGCPSVMTLNPANNYCYWDIPNWGNGVELSPGGNTTFMISGGDTFTCDANNDSIMAAWSGNFWASTGCSDSPGCETGICFRGANDPLNGYCPEPFTAPVGPLTRVEMTLTTTRDTYDVSSIDGINLPVEIRPVSPVGNASDYGVTGISAQFWCGNPGGVVTKTERLSNCSWSYDFTDVSGGYGDRTTSFALVARNFTTNNQACTMNADCPDNQVCGVLQELDAFGGPGQRVFPGRCGRFIGVWTANALCSWSSGYTGDEFPNNMPFMCMTSTDQGSGTFGDLQRCAAQYSASGYTAVEQCDNEATCGCVNWESVMIPAPATQSCVCTNEVWSGSALPWLEPVKRACPTSYSYPFDDASATFQCTNHQATQNTQGYRITFCPAGDGVELVASAGMITYKLWILGLMIALGLVL